MSEACLHRGFRALLAVTLVAVPLSPGVVRAAAARTTVGANAEWIVLGSNRDGFARAYSVRPDGSRLTPLLTRSHPLLPVAESRDGTTIAYTDNRYAIYVSRADGTRLRRLVRHGFGAALSGDGSLLAFSGDKGIAVVGTDGRHRRGVASRVFGSPEWSPDGTALAFTRSVTESVDVMIVQPLRGSKRVVARGFFLQYEWSPDGRWIAYTNSPDDHTELFVVQPNGAHRHRISRDAGRFAWSPDGKQLAFSVRDGSDVAVADLDGHARRLRLGHAYVGGLAWSPDARRLALAANDCCYSREIWIVGLDGRRLHRLVTEGTNTLVGWTRLAPVLPPARPVPPTERVVDARELRVQPSITSVAADGARVAFIEDSISTDCAHVAVWTPAKKSVRRFSARAPCLEVSNREGWFAVGLAGTRAAWLHTAGGNNLEQYVLTATLATPTITDVGEAFAFGDESYGTFFGGLAGDGDLLAFTIERRCSEYETDSDACPVGRRTGDVIAATLYRVGGAGPCPVSTGPSPHACTVVAKADGELTVLAVNAGRIAVRTRTGVRLLTASGSTIRDFVVKAEAAALSGNRLAVRTADAVEVYDTVSGQLATRLAVPQNVSLEDLEGDIVVTAVRGTVTLRRLTDGRTTTITVRGVARAQLEAPGLFVAGTGRVTFTPMSEVLRRLGG